MKPLILTHCDEQGPATPAEELKRLTEQPFAMAGLAERRLQTVLRALVNRNWRSVNEVIAGDSDIDDLQIEIDSSCFSFAAVSPSVDLRTIVSVLAINADLERVGDLAVNIAEAGQRYLVRPGQAAD